MMTALLAGLLLAQAAVTPAYVTQTSGDQLLALATPDGRWVIQLDPSCTAIGPNSEVYLTGLPDDSATLLVAESGESCALAGRQHVSDVPCLTRNGVCDVSRDWSW